MANEKEITLKSLGARIYYCVVNGACGKIGVSKLEVRFPSDLIYGAKKSRPMKQISFDIEECTLGHKRSVMAERLTDESHKTNSKSGFWKHYQTGANQLKLKPTPDNQPSLIERVEKEIPGSIAAYRTPLWSLFDDGLMTKEALVNLVRVLPKPYHNKLLASYSGITSEVVTFRILCNADLDEYALKNHWWDLGAVACIIRISEYTGNSPLQRYAIKILFCMLKDLENDGTLTMVAREVYEFIYCRLRDIVYATPIDEIRMPIKEKEISKLYTELKSKKNVEEIEKQFQA
jgi:hypothetical protein